MSKKLNLYNLNFFDTKDFNSFAVSGYSFCPLFGKQPKRKSVMSSDYFLKLNRGMKLNSYVIIPKRQEDSIFYKGGKYSDYRRRKFLDDLLLIISILIGKNVVAGFYKKYNDFPLCSAKHCSMIATDSQELKKYLEIVIPKIIDPIWQKKYDSGFHLRMFYNSANIFIEEFRFLANISIWEYLFYCDYKDKTFEYIEKFSLNSKIYLIIKNYFYNNKIKVKEEKFRIFSDLRNQLSHNGKLPIQNPKSPFRKIGHVGCGHYMKFFQYLTQALVLKTIGIDAIDKLRLFDIKKHLEELVVKGSVSHFENMDKAGIRP